MLQAAAKAKVKLKKVTVLSGDAMPLLAHAASFGQLACVRFLLDFGCDVNAVFETAAVGAKKNACDPVISSDMHSDEDLRAQVLALLRAAGGKCYAEL